MTQQTDKEQKLPVERKRYPWEEQRTEVDVNRRFDKRLRRFLLSWWRTPLILFIYALLTDADFARLVQSSVTQSVEILAQGFAFEFNIPAIIGLIIQIVFTLSLAILQFVAIFWFLGRARMYEIWPGSTSEGVSFKDYRGHPELLEQARQVVTLLRGVRVFEESGGEPLNGLLLEGPPGTGKTWMAQAISTEAGVPFFYIDASSMSSMFVGIAPLKVMNLYRKARKAAKDYGASIVFIDEIDAVGARGNVTTGEQSSDNPEQQFRLSRNRLPIFFGGGGANMGLLSTLLTEMDGFSLEHGFWARQRSRFYKLILRRRPPKPEKRILTIGATNRIGALDVAMLRPGRFDKKIRVDPPDMEGRRDIFEYYLSKIKHDETMDPLILASETPFYTPADIKYLLNESLRHAMFEGRTFITYEDFRQAQPEHEYGLKMPLRNARREDLRRLAAHEAGHAIAVRLYRPNYRIARITIIPQGGALGYMLSYPALEDYDYMDSYENLINRLRVSIGGKAAEMEFCGIDFQSLGVGVGFGDGSDFGNIRFVLDRMAYAGMFGMMGTDKENPAMIEAMENMFLTVLEEVRLAFRIHKNMGEELIQLLLDKELLMAKEIETFFDRYGLYTPKVEIGPSNGVKASIVSQEGISV